VEDTTADISCPEQIPIGLFQKTFKSKVSTSKPTAGGIENQRRPHINIIAPTLYLRPYGWRRWINFKISAGSTTNRNSTTPDLAKFVRDPKYPQNY
jgi:hypothetical protein